MGEINTIVLDIGNVLAEFRWMDYLKDCGYDNDVFLKVGNATVRSKLWKELDRGAIEEAELIDMFCRQDPSVEKEIRKLFDDIIELVKEYDYSADFIRQLKANGYKVYLLSNYSKRLFELDKNYFKFIPLVNGEIISSKIKCIKPEPAIYEALINKYNINPAEAVFLDDMQENLDGATPFGFHTILVKSHEQALKDLRKLGVLLS